MALNKIRSLLVDRIGITVKIGSQNLYKFAYAQLYSMKDEQKQFVPSGMIKVRKNKYWTRLDYYAAYAHKKAGRRKIADITIGANKQAGQSALHRYLTLSQYPSQFHVGEFDAFKWVLETMLPEFNYAKLYTTGKVNYLELASDTLSQKHHSFLPYRKYCNKSNIYKKGAYCGATYVGSRTTYSRFRIYDKRKQLLDTGKTLIADSAVHTRIEAVMRRLGLAPADLIQTPNPFMKLLVADHAKAKAASDDEDWQNFLVECLTADGVPDALAKRSRYRRNKYLGMLDAAPAWWWQPKLVWERLPEALAKIAP